MTYKVIINSYIWKFERAERDKLGRLEKLQRDSGGMWVLRNEIAGNLYGLFYDSFMATFLYIIEPDRSFFYFLGMLVSYHFFGAISRYCSAWLLYKKSVRFHIVVAIISGAIWGAIFFEIITGNNLHDLIFIAPQFTIKRVLFGIMYFMITGQSMHNIRERVKAEKSLLEQQKQNLQYEKDLVEIELLALQSQIEPHFLFNTLANIQALISKSPKSAKQMLTQFTDLLRHSLARTRSKETNIGMELDIIEKYLSIQQYRLGERLQYDIDCNEEDRQILIAPLLVQPLVENAVIHGIEPAIEGGKVTISVVRKNNSVEIKIADTGQGFSEKTQGHGIGLTNVRNRLKALYGGKANLSITEQDPNGVVSKITIKRNSDE